MNFSLLNETWTFAEWKAVNEALENGTLVMTFGRFNPPTIGHHWLFQKMHTIATRERGVPLVFASHTQDPKKNPLPYDQKCKWIAKLLPKGVKLVKTKARNMQEILKELMPKGFRRLILIVGDDRVEGFSWIDKYKEDFGFHNVKIVSAGVRGGTDAIENASATQMRACAKAGDYDAFKALSPFSDKDTETLYTQIRAALK